MKLIEIILSKIGIITLQLRKAEKNEPKKKSVLNELLESPENFVLTAFIENEEVIVKIKKKGEEE